MGIEVERWWNKCYDNLSVFRIDAHQRIEPMAVAIIGVAPTDEYIDDLFAGYERFDHVSRVDRIDVVCDKNPGDRDHSACANE